jgi:hypothetical protein
VLDSITDGLAVLDKNWLYTYFSEKGARIYRHRAGSLVHPGGDATFPLADHACAVIATMVYDGGAALRRGYKRVASKPSISGICTSMRMRSKPP